MYRFLILGFAMTLMACDSANVSNSNADQGSEVVTLDGLKSKTPAKWKSESPTSKMRAYQFVLPKAEGDKKDAELVIFYFGKGGGGGVEANLDRWKSQFKAPEGKKIDDIVKVQEFKVGDVAVTYLDIEGIYLSKFPPFDPNAKVTPMPDYRRIGVIFASENGPYFMTLTGPARTVAAHKDDFDNWLKSFK